MELEEGGFYKKNDEVGWELLGHIVGKFIKTKARSR